MPIKKTSEKKTPTKKSWEKKTTVKKTTEKNKSEIKICPYCWNEIKEKAIKCQYCGEWFQKKSTTRSGWENRETRRSTAKAIDHKENSFVSFITWTDLNRIWRAKYLARSVVFDVLIYVCMLLALWIMSAFENTNWGGVMNIFWAIIVLAVCGLSLYWNIVLNNKRLHDWWWSWWAQLLLLVPFVNFIFSICMRVIPWNKWENEYGEHCNSKTREKVVAIICVWIIPLWILIAALMPRMSAAQGRARDVARKTALSQIQSAIVTYQGDYGKWPWMDRAKNWIPVSEIQSELISAGMTSVPRDPLRDVKLTWLWSYQGDGEGNYAYIVSRRNGIDNWWFVLMAKTEVPWWSNWVVCDDGEWKINTETDLSNIMLCDMVEKWDYCSNSSWRCTYSSEGELRYITIY